MKKNKMTDDESFMAIPVLILFALAVIMLIALFCYTSSKPASEKQHEEIVSATEVTAKGEVTEEVKDKPEEIEEVEKEAEEPLVAKEISEEQIINRFVKPPTDEDDYFNFHSGSLEIMCNGLHYFDFGGLITQDLGLYAGQFLHEGNYEERIKLSGNPAAIVNDELNTGLVISGDEEGILRSNSERLLAISTLIASDEIASRITIKRGDTLYRYQLEPVPFRTDRIVMTASGQTDGDSFRFGLPYPFMMEREAFKVFIDIIKANAIEDDNPFETIGVEYETLDVETESND